MPNDPRIPTKEFLESIGLQHKERYLPSTMDESHTILEKLNRMGYDVNENTKITLEVIKRWNEFSTWLDKEFPDDVNKQITNRVSKELTNEKIVNLTKPTINTLVDGKLGVVNETLTTVTTQLTEKANKSVTDNIIKNTQTLAKLPTPLKMMDSFSNGIFNFDATKGITASSSGLTITTDANRPNHTNVAVFNAMDNVRGYEVTIGSNPSVIRLGFGNGVENFSFINFTSGEYFLINVGSLVPDNLMSNLKKLTFTVGDRVKLIIYGMIICVFKNDELVANYIPRTDYINRKLDKLGKNYPAISFRDGTPTNTYTINNIKVFQKTYPKFMHLSIDDENFTLKDLTEKAPVSIFDIPNFAFLKDMHDKYGAIFTLYLFNRASTFSLSSVPATYIDQFRANSDWLKFGFHGLDANADYETLDSVTSKSHWDTVMSEIARFASPQAIDTMPRISSFKGNLSNCLAWRDTTYGATGFLTADDDRELNYYLSPLQKETLRNVDDHYDSVNKLFFMKSDLRLDNEVNAYETLKTRQIASSTRYQNESLILFWHQALPYTDIHKKAVEDSCKFAIDNGYVFLYPMHVNPKF